MLKPTLFPFGGIYATPNAIDSIPERERLDALLRHLSGDWGDVCEEDRAENEFALAQGLRLFSVYRSEADPRVKFWIITEADRSITTILMPEDY